MISLDRLTCSLDTTHWDTYPLSKKLSHFGAPVSQFYVNRPLQISTNNKNQVNIMFYDTFKYFISWNIKESSVFINNIPDKSGYFLVLALERTWVRLGSYKLEQGPDLVDYRLNSTQKLRAFKFFSSGITKIIPEYNPRFKLVNFFLF